MHFYQNRWPIPKTKQSVAWYPDDGGGYERVLPSEVTHIVGKENTQRLERTNGMIRQQIGRWHRQ